VETISTLAEFTSGDHLKEVEQKVLNHNFLIVKQLDTPTETRRAYQCASLKLVFLTVKGRHFLKVERPYHSLDQLPSFAAMLRQFLESYGLQESEEFCNEHSGLSGRN
jgi:hypothetical protein